MCSCTTQQKPKAPNPSYIETWCDWQRIHFKATKSWSVARSRHKPSCSNMCSGSRNSKKLSSSTVAIRQQQKQKKISHVSVTLKTKRLRLKRAGVEMELMNLRLYLENQRILADNERLRERAGELSRENLALRANLCKTAPALAGAEALGC